MAPVVALLGRRHAIGAGHAGLRREATQFVLTIAGSLLVLMALVCARLGRLAKPDHVLELEEGQLIARAEKILARAARRERERTPA